MKEFALIVGTALALYTLGQWLMLLWQKRYGTWDKQIQIHDHGVWNFVHVEPALLAGTLLILSWVLFEMEKL